MNHEQLEIQKRLTLNWLIQGAAQHAGMTFQHLVRDELNALDPKLLRLYDQLALIALLQYWRGAATLMIGWPPRFWKRAQTHSDHPFHGHRLLSQYGGILAEAGRRRALERCKEKGVTRLPCAFSFQVLRIVQQLRALEAPHLPELVELAKGTASKIWGIPRDRFEGHLVARIMVQPDQFPCRTARGALLRPGIVGYSEVEPRNGKLIVVGWGINWLLLAKELVKGTAELICLHGLNRLSEDAYYDVIETTDQFELEPWMLQSGGELWRRVLASLPADIPVANALMHLALLPPEALDAMMATIIETPEKAVTCWAGVAK